MDTGPGLSSLYPEPGFIQNHQPKGTGNGQLAAWVGAHHQMGGLLADATGHGSRRRLNPLLRFSPAEGGQGCR